MSNQDKKEKPKEEEKTLHQKEIESLATKNPSFSRKTRVDTKPIVGKKMSR